MTTSGAPLFFRLWGVPFILVGLYFVAGRFVVDMVLPRATRYELTDRRILIERGGLFCTTTTLFLSDLPSVNLKVGASGRGTIRLCADAAWSMMNRGGFATRTPALDRTPQLLGIDRAEAVFDMIQHAQNEQWQRPA